MKSHATIEVRHPYVGEVPAELIVGFEGYLIDAEWQWVLIAGGKVVAQMLCAPMHGVLMIVRLTALPVAPHGWALTLFRRVLKECHAKKMIGYTTFLSDATRAERRLMKIVTRAGGYLVPVSGVWAAGRFNTGY